MKQDTLQKRITANEFHPEVYIYPTPRIYKQLENFKLEKANFGDEINLYIHIPFCKQICSFCGYLKMIDTKGEIQDNYVNALIKEIQMYKPVLSNKTINTLHFGGGTPSLLSVSNIEKIITTLTNINPQILETSKEISIEATPESVEETKFKEYKKIGINRVSMGIQTLNNNEIKLSKRNNLSNITTHAIETLRKINIQNIVADIMIGIENQTIESFEKTINELIEFKLETVELYALGLMPQTSLGKKINFKSMKNKEIYDCYNIGRKLFLEAGYVQDCHNRYIIPGKGSFLQEDNVWHGEGLIGFGAGVRSYAKNIHYRNTYSQNFPKIAINNYIKKINNNEMAVETGIYLSKDETIRQYTIGNLESLDKKEFKIKFNSSFKNTFSKLYNELVELKLIIEDEKKIKLTTKGLNFRDLICTELFSEQVKISEEIYRPKNHE
ncbi:MAG: coproporphyrinogen-III oxidase family protein [Candidatus Woesearchaeota archaeon]